MVLIFRQVRNTTFLLDYAGCRFLINPVLEDGSGLGRSASLPVSLGELLDVDAVIATKLSEHSFDAGARRWIPRGTKVFVQDERDAMELGNFGFSNLEVLGDATHFHYLDLHKIPAFQGQGFTPRRDERSCGVMITHPVLNSTYITGESVWYDDMKPTIKTWKPRLIIVSATNPTPLGIRTGMNQEEIAAVHLTMPRAKIIATRPYGSKEGEKNLRAYLQAHRMENAVLLPEDGVEYRL